MAERMTSDSTQPNKEDVFEILERKIKALNETVWEGRCDLPTVKEWLQQFCGQSGCGDAEQEQLQMMFLLSNFIYFGSQEIRELLRSLFRDIFKYNIIERIRRDHANTKDRTFIETKFHEELKATRFLPVG